MAKGGQPRLQGLDPQDFSHESSVWPSLPRAGHNAGPPTATQCFDRQPRGQCVTVWLGHSHLGLLNASDPRVSPRFLAED